MNFEWKFGRKTPPEIRRKAPDIPGVFEGSSLLLVVSMSLFPGTKMKRNLLLLEPLPFLGKRFGPSLFFMGAIYFCSHYI